MANLQRQSIAPAGRVLLSTAVFGALAGAGSLAWWLWRQSRQRATSGPSAAAPHPCRLAGSASKGTPGEPNSQRDGLPDRVQQLNQAIEEVRRQLEALHSQP